LIGKYVGGENFPQMMKVPDVRIAQDLFLVVVHETVAEGVEVRQEGEKEEQAHPCSVGPARRVQPTGHALHQTGLLSRLLEVQCLLHGELSD